MFEDVSTHSQSGVEDNHHNPHPRPHAPPHGIMGGSAINATKALGDMKNAFGSLNVFGNSAPKPSNNGHPAKKAGGPGAGAGKG